jgi:hypothetical protein
MVITMGFKTVGFSINFYVLLTTMVGKELQPLKSCRSPEIPIQDL